MPERSISSGTVRRRGVAVEPKVSTAEQPSLAPLWVAAVVGVVAAIVLVIFGFGVSPLVGGIAIILAPVLPLACVMATDWLRRD